MNDDLEHTLTTLLRSGAGSNPALNALLRDYTDYHVVLVVVGGLFLLAFVLLSITFWRRLRRIRRSGTREAGERWWTFERRTYVGFGLLSVAVGLFLALVVAANLSTVVSPRQGFAGSVGLLRTPAAGTPTDELYRAVTAWLHSGTTDVPSVVQSRIDDRLAWQRPKAITTSALLVLVVLLGAGMWRVLIRRSRVSAGRVTAKDVPLLAGSSAAVVVGLLLMLMVMGNTQGSLAPLSLTLFFG